MAPSGGAHRGTRRPALGAGLVLGVLPLVLPLQAARGHQACLFVLGYRHGAPFRGFLSTCMHAFDDHLAKGARGKGVGAVVERGALRAPSPRLCIMQLACHTPRYCFDQGWRNGAAGRTRLRQGALGLLEIDCLAQRNLLAQMTAAVIPRTVFASAELRCL